VKVLGVIPARGGSKAIPRKNIAPLGGRPLIDWSLKAAACSRLDRVIVSTDDPEIRSITQQLGGDVPFLRPVEMATDDAETIDVILHAMTVVGSGYDAVMVLQPTSPFRLSDDIDSCIDLLAEDPLADSVISVVAVGGHHPARMKYLEHGVLVDPTFGELRENQPRQELQPMFIRNGAIYLTRWKTLLERSFKGKRSLGYEMPVERSVNIDEFHDLRFAEWLLKSR
jgi:CMP-N-acetylneuraminic acid synthetase